MSQPKGMTFWRPGSQAPTETVLLGQGLRNLRYLEN